MKKPLLSFLCGWRLLSILIHLILSQPALSQIADYGKSYFNVTKGTNGGTVEPGDTLEVRASFVVRNSGFFDSCAFFDVIPTGTTYITGTIRVLTNEAKVYKQFSDLRFNLTTPPAHDEGWITGSNITIHLGYNQTDAAATVYRRGRVRNTHKPSFYLNTCIMVASYRVRVTATYGTTINMGGGQFTYKLGTNPLVTTTLPSNLVAIYRNYGVCANTIGGNALGTESNGTFGSGRPRNRVASASVPPSYTYNIFDVGTPNDYTYGIPNNTSTRSRYTTSNAWPKPDPDPDGPGPLTTRRVFQVWDIIGDHTGAASPTLGNPAADTVANANAGYMLVINASYRIDSAFQHTISGLCPNTYYEISCWMRNVCSKCGCDSNGKGASDPSGPVLYIPTTTGDSSGVYPSIIFEVDGVDYYSTGQLRYDGRWVKKGFTYLVGASGSFTLKYKNNAPGGGGNDWALDDISVSTCSPNLTFSPSTLPFLCDSNMAELSSTVRSFYDNYRYYKWQRSTNGGATWTDITPASGPATPVLVGTEWQYTVNLPPFFVTMADSGHQYRMVVATSTINLNNVNCRFTDATNVITLNVNECDSVLNASITAFNGRLINQRASLSWTTTREETPVKFDIEKSINSINYQSIAVVDGYNNPSSETNQYTFTEPVALVDPAWFRVKMTDQLSGEVKYTRVVQLSPSRTGTSIQSLINPFKDEVRFDLTADYNGTVETILVDQLGKYVKKMSFPVSRGLNPISIRDCGGLAPGVYTLMVNANGLIMNRKLVKH